MWRKRNPHTLLMGMQIGTTALENSIEVSYKAKNRVIIWSSNPAPVHISGKGENSNLKRCMHPSVHSSAIYKNQDIKKKEPRHESNLNVNTYEWLKKMCYIHNGIALSCRKEWNGAIWSNMDELRDYHTKWSKSDKVKYQMMSLTCGISKNDTDELI